MSNITVTSSNICGSITPIASKSYGHRLLICGALYGKGVEIKNLPMSKDIEATISCLKSLGCEITLKEDSVFVGNIKQGLTDCVLDANESGSTLRFFLPILGVLGGKYQIKGSKRLIQRGNEVLFKALSANGLCIEEKTESIIVEGKLKSGQYILPGNVSSQYFSGLMLALPLLGEQSQIVLQGKLQSVDYVNMTIDTLNKFGVQVERTSSGFDVSSFSGDNNIEDIKVEGDWSNGAFFVVLSALCGNLEVLGLEYSSMQGDKRIKDIVILANAKEIEGKLGGIVFEKSSLKGFSYDCSDIPDLVPILAVFASFCEGKTILKGVERLKIKESNRIESTISMLNSFGAIAKYNDDSIIVYGKERNGDGCRIVDCYNDHRIVMASAVMAVMSEGSCKLVGTEAVAKSYPEFFQELSKIGGKFSVDV